MRGGISQKYHSLIAPLNTPLSLSQPSMNFRFVSGDFMKNFSDIFGFRLFPDSFRLFRDFFTAKTLRRKVGMLLVIPFTSAKN
jgi:hypothetical protein